MTLKTLFLTATLTLGVTPLHAKSFADFLDPSVAGPIGDTHPPEPVSRTPYECTIAPFNSEPDCIERNKQIHEGQLAACNKLPTTIGVLFCRWDTK
jgi:hypothetical protein